MPALKDLLSKTMLFTAAGSIGFDPASKTYATKKAAGAAISFAAPTSVATPAADRAIWHFTHDAGTPAKISDLTALVLPPRADGSSNTASTPMPMAVCDSIEALSVKVRTNFVQQDAIDLPLTQKFVVAKFFLANGRVPGPIPAGMGGSTLPVQIPTGWWRLESNTDASILVVFAYEIVNPGGTDPPATVQLEDLESATAFPGSGVGKDDPDFIDPNPLFGAIPQAGSPGAQKAVQTTVTVVPPRFFVVVAFGLTTCKQRADFEPGGVLGAARVYPHVMVTASQGLAQVETTVAVDRPRTEAMKHDPEMMDEVDHLLVADTNSRQNLFSFIRAPPLPVWSNFFDYWNATPATGVDFKVVDPSKTSARPVTGAILRERSSSLSRSINGLYESSSTFTKFAGQGAYDNLHIAPRMKFTSANKGGPVIPNIPMAPFCIHDCFHTHFRWGTIAGSLPDSNRGFNGRTPYVGDGTPLVPANQSVFLTLTKDGAKVGFQYHAIQTAPILPSTWSVFYHHGSAYAVEVEGTFLVGLARTGVQELAKQFNEPFTSLLTSPMSDSSVTVIDDVMPVDSWGAFYQRLQFTGEAPSTTWQPRIKILHLDQCENG